jgi:hypothetical protein
MATVTPNFNWPVPTSTDLVKDGATAIEALGDSIDASLVDLKGGTSGQVLSKNSNTDMDFVWVTSDDANAIQNTIVDAKGDLITATAADTPARLAVGANGETLVADSSTSTGLRYQGAMAAGKNAMINGGFDIWQRGTSFASSNSSTNYTTDRWNFYRGVVTGGTVSRQTSGLTGFQYAARVQRDSGNTSTDTLYFMQNVDTATSTPFAGKTVTLSYYARAGANFSPGGSNMGVQIYTGTGTDQNVLGTYTGINLLLDVNQAITTTWTRYSHTVAIASTVTEFCPRFLMAPTGTAGAADYFEITGVQLEIGSVATNFSRAGGTIQGELAACQRYYLQIATGNSVPISLVWYDSASLIRGLYQMPVVMRTNPTLVQTTGTNYYATQDGDGFNSLTLYNSSANVAAWYNNTEVSGTNSRPQGINTNNASASLGLSAEL